ncbi:MAG: sulfatase-like hydrolase/transferase [Acidobacteria bacterium]|nr:sulfatase-like hydrolase/transferase [Acidobacteriota bacterium]
MDLGGTRPDPVWRSALHLLGLWSVAVAQPLLDLLGKNPTFFIAHRADPFDVAALPAALVLVVPAALAAAIWAAGLLGGPRVRRFAVAATVSLLAAAIVMLPVKQAGVQTWIVAMPLAAALGLAAGWAYLRSAAARTFATVLSVAVLVVPAVFLAQPGIRRLLSPPPQPGTGEVSLRSGSPRPSSPVLLVVIDETPLLSLLDAEGLIDSTLYPNLAQLARDGVWFRNATAVSDDTRWAVPAILSARYPDPSLMPTQADYPHSLFTQLAGSHRLRVAESITRLCRFEACNPERPPFVERAAALADDLRILYLHRVLTDDLRRSLPELTADWARWGVAGAVERRQRRAERLQRRTNHLEIANEFARWIEPDAGRPAFYYLHSLLPHSPWQWLPSGQRNATRAPILDAGVPDSPESAWGVAQLYQRHLLQIGTVDLVIGRYLQRLEETGLYDRALIVVVADHGAAFQAGLPRREFRPETAAEIMRVPLLVKLPGGTPGVPGTVEIKGERISDRNAETIDVAPTILDVLGLEPASPGDGASLLRPLSNDRPAKRIVFAGGTASQTYGASGPDVGPALAAKVNRFGGAGNPYRLPRPERFANLAGRPLSELDVQDSGVGAVVDQLSSFESFRPGRTRTPFDLSGRLTGLRTDGGVTWVAVGVNGVVRAVTRTWESEPDRWLATPPLDAWKRDHRNEVEIFVVGGDERSPVLRRAKLSRTSTAGG